MSKSYSILRLTRRRASKLSSTSSTCQTKLATTYTCEKSARCLATVNAGPRVLPDIWFTGSNPRNENSPPNFGNSNKPPNNERTSPLPQEILSPQITLHLFPSTHPHLPTVSGRVAYSAALWTSPIAWGRVPLVGNVKLQILSERMSQSSSRGSTREQLIVRWKTIGKTKNKGTGGFYKGIGARENVDKITEWLGGGSGEDDSKEFTGLFLFEFDEEGRIWSHTIEHVQEGGNWERGVGAKVVGLTDWLLGGMKNGRGDEGAPCPAFWVHERNLGRR
ncbi:hypothetical protein BOTNAR_0001g00790 [Botryotinia narcissicola]|uniref:Uncharacterized protein n=1 Tax=Botryotinia narcissicola TaxID=278944 RepID=A0A4Z1JM59_9HELO|nr:hypothetical protein BOTNAR_0001g00790 [Botryotinia narcissicola]